MFDEYVRHGWVICAVDRGTKGPKTKGWNIREGGITDPAVAATLQGAGLCHAFSGTCSIDVDDYPRAAAWLQLQGVDLDALMMDPRCVQIVSGKINRAKLLYRLAEPLASCSLAPYRAPSKNTGKEEVFHALELRCATRGGATVQDILPGSIHPDTNKPYIWAYGDELTGHWSNLPELPSAVLALWKAQQVDLQPAQQEAAAPKGLEFDELIERLRRVDPNDFAYDQWLKIGMAIHHETSGDPAAYKVWRDWSARSTKHDEQHMLTKWRSFKADTKGGVTLGSALREQVASPTEFPDVGDTDVGEDTRLEATIRKLLEDRLVYIRAQALYFDISRRGDVSLTDRSIQHLFLPYMPYAKKENKKTKEVTRVKVEPVSWLKNSKTKKVVDQIGIHPGAGRLYSEDDLDYVNRYVPHAIEALAPKPHEREAIDFLWSRIVDPKMAVWLMRFYAFAMRNPGVKIQSAPLLFSEETGTGKNTLARTVPQLLFGRRWVRGVSGDVLASNFSDVLGETWWLYLEELKAGSSKLERIALANKMKVWVTDEILTVHPKGLKPYDLRNRLQITATSNFSDAIHIDNNDRRWAIIAMDPRPFTEREGMDIYGGFLKTDRAAGVLKYFFERVDLTGFNPAARAPYSDAKKTMIDLGIGTMESRIVEMMAAREAPFDRDLVTIKDVQQFVPGLSVTSAPFVAGLLKKSPLNCEPLRDSKGTVWCWINNLQWRKAPEGARRSHILDGSRPAGSWNTKAPDAILALSPDAGVDSPTFDNCADLL